MAAESEVAIKSVYRLINNVVAHQCNDTASMLTIDSEQAALSGEKSWQNENEAKIKSGMARCVHYARNHLQKHVNEIR